MTDSSRARLRAAASSSSVAERPAEPVSSSLMASTWHRHGKPSAIQNRVRMRTPAAWSPRVRASRFARPGLAQYAPLFTEHKELIQGTFQLRPKISIRLRHDFCFKILRGT